MGAEPQDHFATGVGGGLAFHAACRASRPLAVLLSRVGWQARKAPNGRDKGIARRDVVAFAAFGLSILALAVPAVWVARARMGAISALTPVVRAASSARRHGAEGEASGASGELGVTPELERLRRELVRLEDERRRLEEELGSALGFADARERAGLDVGRFIEAFVIGHSVNWQERSFLIDRGRADGVVPRAGVLWGGAVAGVVVEVGSHAARVGVPAEPGVRVAARTLHTRRSGIVTGIGDGCELRYVERWVASLPRPQEKEPVVTSGRLGFFPPGFLVGWVASVGEPAESLHLRIAIRPELVDPPEGRVWVLKPGPREVQDAEGTP